MKWVLLVKLSVVTHIELTTYAVLGNFVMKSIAISSHFHMVMGNGCILFWGLWYSALTFRQDKHLSMYHIISLFIHLCGLGWIENFELWASSNKIFLTPSEAGTYTLPHWAQFSFPHFKNSPIKDFEFKRSNFCVLYIKINKLGFWFSSKASSSKSRKSWSKPRSSNLTCIHATRVSFYGPFTIFNVLGGSYIHVSILR